MKAFAGVKQLLRKLKVLEKRIKSFHVSMLKPNSEKSGQARKGALPPPPIGLFAVRDSLQLFPPSEETDIQVLTGLTCIFLRKPMVRPARMGLQPSK